MIKHFMMADGLCMDMPWGAHWCNLANTIEPSCVAAMQHFVKLI